MTRDSATPLRYAQNDEVGALRYAQNDGGEFVIPRPVAESLRLAVRDATI